MIEFGLVLWALFLGAFLILEGLGFIHGQDQMPTASQLIVRWKHRYAWFRFLLILALVVVGPVLYLHWIVELF